MNLCSKNHEEICYEERICPACELLRDIVYLQEKIDKLQADNEELNNREI